MILCSEATRKAVDIGNSVKLPNGILARCTHAYAVALAMDPARRDEAEAQRLEARRVRALVPGGPWDYDDDSDEAFEELIKMDHR